MLACARQIPCFHASRPGKSVQICLLPGQRAHKAYDMSRQRQYGVPLNVRTYEMHCAGFDSAKTSFGVSAALHVVCSQATSQPWRDLQLMSHSDADCCRDNWYSSVEEGCVVVNVQGCVGSSESNACRSSTICTDYLAWSANHSKLRRPPYEYHVL